MSDRMSVDTTGPLEESIPWTKRLVEFSDSLGLGKFSRDTNSEDPGWLQPAFHGGVCRYWWQPRVDPCAGVAAAAVKHYAPLALCCSEE